jgi:hypothetical protein
MQIIVATIILVVQIAGTSLLAAVLALVVLIYVGICVVICVE